jgi:hypothetical protein
MGNIATPNTPYCLGFQQASLSVGNKTFSTQNPPISYSIDGSTVTVFDALGAIGITSYSSNDFVEISSSPASPNTNYCSSAKAVLSWSGGTVETLNAPISYQLRSNIVEWGNDGIVQGFYNAPMAVNSASIESNTNKLLINGQVQTFNKQILSWETSPQSGGIEVDWGGGDKEVLPGESWEQTTLSVPLYIYAKSLNITWSGNTIYFSPNPFGGEGLLVKVATSPIRNLFVCEYNGSSNPWRITHYIWGWSFGNENIPASWVFSSFNSIQTNRFTQYLRDPCWFEQALGNNGENIFTASDCPTGRNATGSLESPQGDWVSRIMSSQPVIRITTNTGAISERQTTIPPNVTLLTGSCDLIINFTDSTQQEISFDECPTVESIPGCTVAIIFADATTESILVNPCPDFVNIINNEVTVSDGTGQIFKTDYLTPPLNFQVTCYDFNVTEVSYVCQGDCPSGTEFRCVCPTTNTIMCYGFDPENPNVFKPLFTTQVTS